MNDSLVSVCIPVYNAVKYIEETIDCFINQTYKNIEIIVNDDRSTDGTWELLNDKYANIDFVKLFRNTANGGIGINWNNAYANAKGEFVVIANADDIFFPHFIETALKPFNELDNIDAVSFKYQILDNASGVKNNIAIQNKLSGGIQDHLFEKAFFSNPFHIIFTLFKKRSLDELLLANSELFMRTQICDAELFYRLGRFNRRLFYIPEVIGLYRKHESNNSYKPYGEVYSWLNDVLPQYYSYIKANHYKKYKKLIRKHIVRHVIDSVKKLSMINLNYLNKLYKAYMLKS